jgi:addiction module HigA family antidote
VDVLGAILKLPSSEGIVSERSEVSSELALRLSEALGRSPESSLAMQDNYDLWQVRHSANLSQVRKILFEVNA